MVKLNDLEGFSISDSDCLKKLESVKIKFANGDSFSGTVTSASAFSGEELRLLRVNILIVPEKKLLENTLK